MLYTANDIKQKRGFSKMNCIFICVFNDEKYISMLYFLLESIYIYGNLENETEILIYTSTAFSNKIKQSHLYSDKIRFEINDQYNSIDSACKSRLDLFELASVQRYNTILYLDTNVLVKDDIQKIFSLIIEDRLYAVPEGSIVENHYWGCPLFDGDFEPYKNTTAFNSGILLFRNCEKIKTLFAKIKEDIVLRPQYNRFFDQPYIVYNAFKYDLYDNELLAQVAVLNDTNIHSDKVLHHFSGCVGHPAYKIEPISRFLFELNDFTIAKHIQNTKNYIDSYLLPIIIQSGEELEGNIFMTHRTTIYTTDFLDKAKNISNFVSNRQIKNVMEIGFNSGFSSLLMLISNPDAIITCFDLGDHSYTLPCYAKIKETFGDRIQLVIGNSVETLTHRNEKYDLIHIDGGHDTEVAASDVINSYRLSKPGTILIMDDYDFPNLHTLWDEMKYIYNLKPLDIMVYSTPYHDAIYV
jgi:predicted O-methyltransferase YrrM